MTETEKLPALASLSLALAVDDLEDAIIFYQELGFEQKMRLQDDDGKTTFAMLACGTNGLMLGPSNELHYSNQERTDLFRNNPRGLGVTLILDVPDLNAVYALVKKMKLQIILEPIDEFYGERVFMFVDPFQYEWKICQRTKEMNLSEVIAATKTDE